LYILRGSNCEQGDWKLGGFGFGVSTKENAGDSGHEFPEYDSRLPRSVQRNLDFLGILPLCLAYDVAPEYVIDNKLESPNDMSVFLPSNAYE